MSRLVSRAESWEKVYTAFSNINFAAFDYNSVKQSILDYIKLYFPETFNDFIESSELIAIVESFAYIAEILAYRMDVVAHENFISTAQRRDSILKLAKLISYKASRPLPARGLVKITSVQTSETLIDSNGTNLAGRTIRWNDPSNSAWKDQFVLVLNRVLEQDFGSVVATDRFQIQDVLFEIYPLVTTTGVMPYSTSVYGQSIKMELVPVSKSQGNSFTGSISGIMERRPQRNARFTIMYGSDGLGDGSETTGFFCFTKQGSLQRFSATFDGITPNQVYEIPVNNINDTDVWVNAIDPETGDIIVKMTNLPYRRETLAGKYGEWVEVDIAHAQNVIFNTNPKRNKYEIETVGDNRVRILFGDGEFADIPSGTFDIWARQSLDDDVVVPQSSVIDVPISFTYTDSHNQSQVFKFTISLIGSLTNASAAETTEHVRQTAPAVYYTQDRMVNGQDYNTYMRQNPTILKLRAVNRTFAGDSKYITWHDSSNTYENVKMFGNDGLFYLKDEDATQTTPPTESNTLITTYIEPLLTSTDVFMQLTTAGVDHTKLRRVFSQEEKARIATALTPPPALRAADLYFNKFDYQWYATKAGANVSQDLVFPGYQVVGLNGFATSPDKPLAYQLGVLPPYRANITVGSTTVGVMLNSAPATFGELIGEINSQLALYGATASIINGNIVVTAAPSTSDPDSSAIAITDVLGASSIFTDLQIALNSSVVYQQPVTGYAFPTNFIPTPLIKVRQVSELEPRYTVDRNARRIVLESRTTLFWNTNNADRVVDYDTLRSSFDQVSILQANTNCNRTGILQRTWNYNVLGQELIESGPNAGLADPHRISVIATDENSDKVPDYLDVEDSTSYMGLADIIKPKIKAIARNTDPPLILPTSYIAGMGDIAITAVLSDGTSYELSPPVFTAPMSSQPDQGIDDQAYGIQQPPTSAGWTEVIVDKTTGNYTLASYGVPTNAIKFVNLPEDTNVIVKVNEYVYFHRLSVSDEWLPVEATHENMLSYTNDYVSFMFKYDRICVNPAHSHTYDTGKPVPRFGYDPFSLCVFDTVATTQTHEIRQEYLFKRQWKRYLGRDKMNFAWMHYSPRYQLVDPSPTNIIDIFIITRGYFISFKRWLEDPLAVQPDPLTPLSLRNDYGKMLDNKMASDTVVLHPGKIKLMFGDKASPSLQAKFKVIRSVNSVLTDNQIKNQIVATVRNFFDIAAFEFGETFYFTELASAIHMDLSTEISSVVLVPSYANSQFGDLMQVLAREDEILYPDIDVEDIDIVEGFTATNLRLNG